MDKKSKIINKIQKIDDWLKENDWKVNKIVAGEWQRDDIRWVIYLKEREEKRKLRDELIEQIRSLKVVENED